VDDKNTKENRREIRRMRSTGATSRIEPVCGAACDTNRDEGNDSLDCRLARAYNERGHALLLNAEYP
jgi:hypothetical protein